MNYQKKAEVSDETLTKPEEAKEFVKETGIDLFAPAVGNIHGMVKGRKIQSWTLGELKYYVKLLEYL